MSSILIAEDESRIAAFMEKGLRQNGFDTASATNGEQALEMVRSQDFDLLLLDLVLPIKDGWTVLTELRNQGHQLPIIIVSADSFSKQTGARNDYIAKPFRFQDLLARVQFHLRSAHSSNNR